MNRFLRECRQALHKTTSVNCLVLGNESCDLDSAVSALSFAYFLQEVGSCRLANVNQFIPLLNISRRYLPLKSEVVYFLKQNNVDIETLLCRDDVNMLDFDHYVLVDHHSTSLDMNKVKTIIDHRPRDQTVDIPVSCELILKEVGSCSTLVAEIMINSFSSNGNVSDDLKGALKLLYGAIVLDTVNFSPEADKVRPLDIEVTEKLEELLSITDSGYKTRLFKALNEARSDISTLDSFQILSKDLKIISGLRAVVAIPGFPMSVQKYIRMEEAEENLKSFAEENNCDLVVLMGMEIDQEGTVKRDLAVVNIKNQRLTNEIVKTLEDNPCLQLHKVTTFLGNPVFSQGNIKMSRKQILPILNTFV